MRDTILAALQSDPRRRPSNADELAGLWVAGVPGSPAPWSEATILFLQSLTPGASDDLTEEHYAPTTTPVPRIEAPARRPPAVRQGMVLFRWAVVGAAIGGLVAWLTFQLTGA